MLKITKRRSDDVTRVWMKGEMTIYTAAEAKEKLAPIFDSGENIDINLSKISDIDTAGIQLLILAKQQARRHSFDLSLSSHSEAVIEAMDLFGLTPWFGDPVVIKGEYPGVSQKIEQIKL